MQQEKKYLQVELVIKGEAGIKLLENSQPVYIPKNEKPCSEDNTSHVAKWCFGKISNSVNHKLTQSS